MNEKIYTTVVTQSLKGGDLPEDFVLKGLTINFVDDVTPETHIALEAKELAILAQKKLRAKTVEYLKGLKGSVTFKISEVMEKSPRVVKVLTMDEYVAQVKASGDQKAIDELVAKLTKK